jgi:hypothetical protein
MEDFQPPPVDVIVEKPNQQQIHRLGGCLILVGIVAAVRLMLPARSDPMADPIVQIETRWGNWLLSNFHPQQ